MLDAEPTVDKRMEELEHLRHERNVYEESYIGLQRQLDLVQKENQKLAEDLQLKQQTLDEFESRLELERKDVRQEMETRLNEMKMNANVREKELFDKNEKEKANFISSITTLKVNSCFLLLSERKKQKIP